MKKSISLFDKNYESVSVEKMLSLSKFYVKESVNTVCNACEPITGDTLRNIYGVDWEKDARRYGLKTKGDPTPFVICPVFFKVATDEINVCALSFALLILYKGLEQIEKTGERENVDNIKILIDRLVNTLTVVSCRETDQDGNEVCYWPTKIDKTNSVSSGTCNQTTVALSALLRIGFISNSYVNKKPEGDEQKKAETELRERYKLIVGALSWLVGCQKESAWAYGDKCQTTDGTEIRYSILSSHFCYETLKKYRLFFDSDEGSNELAQETNKRILDRIHAACVKFETWAKRKIIDSVDGGVGKTSASEKMPSVLHSCLIQIVFLYDLELEEESVKAFSKSVKYLLDHLNDFKLDVNSDLLETYKYYYECKTHNGAVSGSFLEDKYEIIPEYVFLSYSTRLIKSGYFMKLSPMQRRTIKKANYIAYCRLLKDVTRIRFKGNDNEYVALQGKREEPLFYPIYGLYDLQCCLIEFIQNEKNPKAIVSATMPNAVPVAIGVAAAGVCAYCALKVDIKNTVTSGLLSLAGFSVGPIKKLRSK
ncbi:MAG: hypothetical protein J5649_09010 [Lachnospiraceae bacterium]|nr:hypothetical protein [Lachnospiraceae bacterium]